MSETTKARPGREPTADEKAYFDARYRWCIRQAMLALRDLPEGLEPRELEPLYEKARNLIFAKLLGQGVDPLTKSELLRVMSEARKLMAELRKQLDDMSIETDQVV